ncbi:adenosylcobinamide-phosphate synthase CbiB [Spirosoma sp. KUDC1026]|uniref:adenosylcobinamide-phosphate synthase CbiB n=1 Tax=Spirosoma sp. KUDC1026 TaxID=2745947 RepID=UPI00159BD8CE|nr:adenosylcobinamide-phosphate synthase CbiB [Spirosoma sp. KUDC1026]QKZ15387.1 cobalamin biosynthesis protein CobD [Spirosoma sp. KUDC1026]
MEQLGLFALPLLLGYVLDLIVGDPDNWPHPIRIFGNLIAKGERLLNKGKLRFWKGAALALSLCILACLFFLGLNQLTLSIHPALFVLTNALWVWYGLANHNLIREGKAVFRVLEQEGVEAGRRQLSRIVGRDTSQLSPQQIRIAVLETMSENLSDGVIAPLFFYGLAGVPGMMTYKMINTLDSMIGYRSERYEQFGKFAARLDDVANVIPARLTALLMVLVTGSKRGLKFALRYGNRHKSPNAGYPEAALAGILNCRFGGPNMYHGVLVEKPYIGELDRPIAPNEIDQVSQINHRTCLLVVTGLVGLHYLLRIYG